VLVGHGIAPPFEIPPAISIETMIENLLNIIIKNKNENQFRNLRFHILKYFEKIDYNSNVSVFKLR
jgi:hypothetical protein